MESVKLLCLFSGWYCNANPSLPSYYKVSALFLLDTSYLWYFDDLFSSLTATSKTAFLQQYENALAALQLAVGFLNPAMNAPVMYGQGHTGVHPNVGMFI